VRIGRFGGLGTVFNGDFFALALYGGTLSLEYDGLASLIAFKGNTMFADTEFRSQQHSPSQAYQ
jgi:hypothetical protein